jgi:sn-glycerol 3-phosphate transport system substrate-binding protein
VAGCSSDGDDDGGTDELNANGDIVVHFWHGYGGQRLEWVNQAVAKYNAQAKGVEVRAESKTDYDKLFDAVLLAAGTKAAPELAQVVVTYTSAALKSGAFTTISDADTEKTIDPSSYMDAVVGQLTVDGKLTSVPWAHSGPVLFYDKGLFRKAGLDPEKPPATWPELLAACEALVKVSKVSEYCIGIPWHPWFVENWMAGQDVPLLDHDNGRSGDAERAALDSEVAQTVFQNWKQLYDEHYYPYSTEGYDFPRQMFSESKTAMTVSSIADAGYFQGAFAEQKRELGIGFFPSASEKPAIGTTLGGASVWLTAGLSPKTKQAALDFLAWLTSPEMAAEWHKATGYFPVNKKAEAILQSEGWFEKNPAFYVALDQLKETKVTPATSGPLHSAMPEVNDAIMKALEQVLIGNVPAADALKSAQEASNSSILRMNKIK